jgi:hypothetical protein
MKMERSKIMLKNKLIFLLTAAIFIEGCGSLGGFQNINFPISKGRLELAIDSLYSTNPEFRIPGKWGIYDNWSKRGYDFLESRIFYFQNPPEEMYYVTFVGDSTTFADTTNITIAIRAINWGAGKWNLSGDVNPDERLRIERRFNDEVVSKLEQITKSKAEFEK